MKILTLCALLVISSSCAERRVCKSIIIERLKIGTHDSYSTVPLELEVDVCYNE